MVFDSSTTRRSTVREDCFVLLGAHNFWARLSDVAEGVGGDNFEYEFLIYVGEILTPVFQIG